MSKGSKRRQGKNYADNWDLIFKKDMSQNDEKMYMSEKRVQKIPKFKHESDHDYREQK